MRQIVVDVCQFLESPEPVPQTLAAAYRELEFLDLRFTCMAVGGWWRRSLLLKSRHPYMGQLSETFRTFVNLTPELSEMVRLDDDRCWFADHLTRDEIAEINAYAMAHYPLKLRT